MKRQWLQQELKKKEVKGIMIPTEDTENAKTTKIPQDIEQIVKNITHTQENIIAKIKNIVNIKRNIPEIIKEVTENPDRVFFFYANVCNCVCVRAMMFFFVFSKKKMSFSCARDDVFL